jgi:hypothetical protein
MKRSQRWSQASDEGPGHRVSPTGPFRRRRALRHLDSLAQHPARELSPDAAVAHVRVIGETGEPARDARNESSMPERATYPAPDDGVAGRGGEEGRNASGRLHAVPIDEPLGGSLGTAAPST